MFEFVFVCGDILWASLSLYRFFFFCILVYSIDTSLTAASTFVNMCCLWFHTYQTEWNFKPILHILVILRIVVVVVLHETASNYTLFHLACLIVLQFRLAACDNEWAFRCVRSKQFWCCCIDFVCAIKVLFFFSCFDYIENVWKRCNKSIQIRYI